MRRPRGQVPLCRPELAVLALLAGMVVAGLVASGSTLQQSLVGIGVLAFLLLVAWLWQLTLRRAETARPLSVKQRAWNAVVFLVAMAALVAWWIANG